MVPGKLGDKKLPVTLQRPAVRVVRKDPLWGQVCLGYSLQARFDGASRESLAAIQRQRLGRGAADWHVTPPETAHISVFSLISVRGAVANKEELWRSLSGLVRPIVAAARAEWTPCTLRFPELELMETALILTTIEQPEPIRSLRRQLNAVVAAAGLPVQVFDRTHVTLARPARDRNIEPEELAALERPGPPIALYIERLELVRERKYPSLECEPVLV
jgi:hypothetical protein